MVRAFILEPFLRGQIRAAYFLQLGEEHGAGLLHPVPGGIGCDLTHPGGEFFAALKAVQMGKSLDVRVLEDIEDVILVPHH